MMLTRSTIPRTGIEAMTEHSDLTSVIAWLEAGCDPAEAAKELRSYQAALSSQSLSLSEAIERGDRYERISDEHRSLIAELKPALSEARADLTASRKLVERRETERDREKERADGNWDAYRDMIRERDAFKAAIEVAVGLFPHVRDDATQHALCVLRNALAASSLENGPAGLADANTKSPDPSLSSLKGAEVAVKPLVWRVFCSRSGNCEAKTPFGDYVIQSEPDGWVLYLMNHDDADAAFLSLEAAKSAAQSDLETRIRSALGSREEQ